MTSFSQVVCERNEVLASGCAVSRAFPLYSRKTPSAASQTITVGFIVVGDKASPVTDEDVQCLTAECEGEWRVECVTLQDTYICTRQYNTTQ